jgi:hypothetical protein
MRSWTAVRAGMLKKFEKIWKTRKPTASPHWGDEERVAPTLVNLTSFKNDVIFIIMAY